MRSVSRLFCCCLLLLSGAVSAQTLKEVHSEVKAVTVFLNRAQITAEANTSLPSGTTELALTNIPAALDVSSIQVQGQGNFILLGVRFDYDYLNQGSKPRALRQAEDSLHFYQNLQRTLNDQIDVYRKEQDMVLANQAIGGQKGVDVDELEDVADFFRNRLMSVKANILKNENRLRTVQESVTRYSQLVSNFGNRNVRPNGRILVTVSADLAVNAHFQISYVVHNAGWKPAYDLRAANTKSPVTFYYKANVFQNTGVPWNRVQLTLATTNPTVGAAKPELQPWYLDIYAPPKRRVFSKQQAASVQAMDEAESLAPPDSPASYGAPVQESKSVSDYVQVSEAALAVNFELKLPYTIPADGKMHLVEMQQYEVPTTFTYVGVPKLAPEAFLTAQLTNWDELNILPGEANVFLEGTFTGKTYLNPVAQGDTLMISLGRDKKVMLLHEKVKEFRSKSFLGSNRKETRGFQLTVRNTKDQPIEIELEDQIPVSNNSQVEVELEEDGGGTLDKATGKITWHLKLKPNEAKKIPLKFSVKYPKNQQITNL